MGCFFSRLKPHPRTQNGHRRRPPAPEAVSDRAPPPSLEQECVKQVLSETHLSKLHPEASGDPTQIMPLVSDEKIEATRQIEKPEVVSPSQVSEMSQSQVSEMCSASESFSTATTFTDKRDDEVMSKPSSDVAHRVGPARPRKRVPKPPARRAEPSPARARQQNAVYGGLRRDHGEASGRRSRSPVTRVRSPMKQTGRAGGRSRNVEGTPNGTVSESLENPHVSLECFIFL